MNTDRKASEPADSGALDAAMIDAARQEVDAAAGAVLPTADVGGARGEGPGTRIGP